MVDGGHDTEWERTLDNGCLVKSSEEAAASLNISDSDLFEDCFKCTYCGADW